MDDRVDAVHSAAHEVEVAYVAHERFVGGIAYVDDVEGAYAMPPGAQSTSYEGSDATGGSGDEDVHPTRLPQVSKSG